MHRANLGSFSTSTFDLSELSLSGLVKLYEGNVSRVHAQIGIQQSVGANDALGEVLTPMNMRKTMILPYGMQSGDGSTSVISALTYVATVGGRAYGGQMSSQNAFATDLWSFGDSLTLTGWIQQELVEKNIAIFSSHLSQAGFDCRSQSSHHGSRSNSQSRQLWWHGYRNRGWTKPTDFSVFWPSR